MKIIADDKIPFLKGALEPYAEVIYVPGKQINREIIMDSDALLIRTRTKCTENLLKGTSVRFIGTATIGRLLINEFGVVDQAAVVRSVPKGLFEKSALEAFAAARFSPGMLMGLPVKSQVTIEVEFAPFNRGANVTDRTY